MTKKMDKILNSNRLVRFLYFYELQNKLCYYCKKPVFDGADFINCDFDHKQPSSRGGKTEVENLCLSFIECNSRKGDMNEKEFAVFKEVVDSGRLSETDGKEYAKYVVLKEKFEALGL